MAAPAFDGDRELLRAIHRALATAVGPHTEAGQALPWGGLREIAYYEGDTGTRIVLRTWAGRDFEVRRIWEDGLVATERSV
jgi:hypothetical protein